MKRINVKGKKITFREGSTVFCYEMIVEYRDEKEPERAFEFSVQSHNEHNLKELRQIFKNLMFFQKDMPLN